MTSVRELIKKLEGYDLDCQVLVRVQDGDIYNHVDITALAKCNPIIEVAKEAMAAAVAVPISDNMKPDLSPSFSNGFRCGNSEISVTLSHEDVIDNIMKSNERKMQRNLELARDREERRNNY